MKYNTENRFPPLTLLLVFLLVISFNSFSQEYDESFLLSLPADVRMQLEESTKTKDDAQLNELFRVDSSLENNKEILRKLKQKIELLDSRILNEDRGGESFSRFGSDFFSSIQTSFMPVNVPNFGDEYILDIGDELTLNLLGRSTDAIIGNIERDGSFIIPEYGKVYFAGKKLEDAQKILTEFLSSQAIGIEGQISLSKLRDIQVLLIGGIKFPGMYTLPGGSSLLHAINVAGGINTNGSFRSIKHLRNSETISSLDLYDLLIHGKNVTNFPLKSGDILMIDPPNFHIPISGGVNSPGVYEIKEGETLSDLLSLARGFSESFSSDDFIYLRRYDLDSDQFLWLRVNLDSLNSIKLNKRDAVVIPFFETEIEKVQYVTVNGMVNKPGKYSITDQDTLHSVMKKAGGYSDGAYPFGGVLKRTSAKMLQDEYSKKVYSDTINEIVSNISSTGGQINGETLKLLLEEVRSQESVGRVVTNFNLDILESNPQMNIKLLDGDEIFIPKLTKQVYLFGDFREPAILPYSSDKTLSNYIDLVAGLRESATKHVIIVNPDGTSEYFNLSGFLGFNKDINIYPGSIIYLPRNIGKVRGIQFASTVAPILSSLAISLASLNSISND